MKMNFLDNCYKLSALSTCVLSEKDNDDWYYGATEQIKFSDHLTAVTKYEPLTSDYMSPYDYEVHLFSIDFFRDGKLLEGFAYERKINQTLYGSLANPDLTIDAKMQTIANLKPGLRSKVRSLTTTSLLTPEEVQLVSSKSIEFQEQAEKKQQLAACFAEAPQQESANQAKVSK